MTNTHKNTVCRSLRLWLGQIIGSRLNIEAGWIQDHLAHCPRCRERILPLGRVEVAMSLLKTQPHQLDLLMRANTKAIGMLKHSLRNAPKAAKLKIMRPEPNFAERYAKYVRPTVNAAACLALLVLAKIGIFESMSQFEQQGQKAIHQYYAKNLGNETADEIFAPPQRNV
jgi:hypothetical protein